MKRISILIAVVFLITVVSGCVEKTPTEEAEVLEKANNTTAEKTVEVKKSNVAFIDEALVRSKLYTDESVKLFLGLYSGADLTLRKSEDLPAWIASYSFGSKNLTLTLNAETAETEATTIPIEYLRSGKYCRVTADCINMGDINSAFCINKVYANKDGAKCEGAQVACSRSIECCKCVQNYCVKKEVFFAANQCPAPKAGTSSASAAKASTTQACSSIKELTVGQKVVSGNKTLEFLASYNQQSVGKFTVKAEDETSTKFVKVKEPQFLAGVTITVKEIIVPISGDSAIAMLSISGMGEICTIS